jgi:hypothetical protein
MVVVIWRHHERDHARDLGRAERYLVGGGRLIQKFAPASFVPLKKNIRGRRGGRSFIFRKHNVPQNFPNTSLSIFTVNFSENSLIFNTFRNSSIPGLPLGKLGPGLFYISLGCYTPPPSSSSHARNILMQVEVDIDIFLENTCMQRPSPYWQNHYILRTWGIQSCFHGNTIKNIKIIKLSISQTYIR